MICAVMSTSLRCSVHSADSQSCQGRSVSSKQLCVGSSSRATNTEQWDIEHSSGSLFICPSRGGIEATLARDEPGDQVGALHDRLWPSRHCEVGSFRSNSGLMPKVVPSRMTQRGRLALN